MDSRPGGLGGSLVAEAVFERLTDEPIWPASDQERKQVVARLRRAEKYSVMHPSHRQVHGWVRAHNAFACSWYLLGEYRMAARHFHAVGNRVGEYPWSAFATHRVFFYRAQLMSLLIGGFQDLLSHGR